MDNLVECTRCGSDACYMQEVSSEIKMYWCYGCGFTCNTAMEKDSEFLTEQMDTLPELYKALMVEEEETGKIWMPSTVNIYDKGMVFANGGNSQNWAWAAVKAIPVKEEEKEKYKLKDGGYAQWKMDMANIKHFPEKDYMEALSYIGILPE
jgi:hypothetical protein